MATAPGPGDSKAARTRARILRVAAREIARRGYGGASLRLIATESDLQLGSLYFHFTSKDELVAEVLREGIDAALDRVVEAIRSLPQEVTGQVRLQTAMRAHLEALHASHDRAAAVVWMTETMPSEVRRKQRIYARRYSQWWHTMLSALQRQGEVRDDIDASVIRDVLIAALNATLSRSHTEARGAHDALVDALTLMIIINPTPSRASGEDSNAPPPS